MTLLRFLITKAPEACALAALLLVLYAVTEGMLRPMLEGMP